MMIAEMTEHLISEVVDNYVNYVNPATVNFLKKLGLDTIARKASGAIIEDVRGNEYIDCIGGYGISNIGHNHPQVVLSLRQELDKNSLLNHPFLNEALGKLSRELAQLLLGNLSCSFICNSGSEAIDSAIKLSRLCTGKSEIIATEGSFHGYTFGALSVSGINSFKKYFHPLVPEIIHVPYNNAAAILNKITNRTAAVILEPVQHESGIRIPSRDFFQEVREICTQEGILLILDEIKTGFGKTGRLFAYEHFDIIPDIMVLGKSMSGGLIPIGAIIAQRGLWRKFSLSFPMSASSFAGNSLACICALSTLRVIKEENLVEKCRDNGKYILGKLQLLQKQHSKILKEVCGLGLLIGIKIIHSAMALKLIREIIKRNILVMPAFGEPSVIMIEPPLCLTREQAEKIILAVEQAASSIENIEM